MSDTPPPPPFPSAPPPFGQNQPGYNPYGPPPGQPPFGGPPPGQPPFGGPPSNYPPFGMSPGPYGQQKPSNHLVWAILTTLFCCLPLGVASIVFASKVDSAWAVGDYQGAMDNSRKAKNLAIGSVVAGIALAIAYAMLIAAGVE